MKTKVSLWTMTVMLAASSAAFCGTVTGTLQTPNGQAIKNATLDFNLEQAGLLAGSGSIVPVTASCYTSADGSVVGLPNPLSGPVATADTGAGSLAGGIYYVETTFYSASLGGGETLPSPELRIQLSSTGSLLVNSPVPFPAGAAGMRVYIGSASGGETLQGQTSGTAQFAQTSALIAGTTAPAANSTACSVDFNDTIIPYS
ncbi:MAG TPA: hypothetical protein VGR96_12505, partial [Acidobacteriaceae bacterium]|nr:hypothetical protein [Acidobacteriaceae bacterium]